MSMRIPPPAQPAKTSNEPSVTDPGRRGRSKATATVHKETVGTDWQGATGVPKARSKSADRASGKAEMAPHAPLADSATLVDIQDKLTREFSTGGRRKLKQDHTAERLNEFFGQAAKELVELSRLLPEVK